jgi:transcriptional regulator with XRE-family HTH domain
MSSENSLDCIQLGRALKAVRKLKGYKQEYVAQIAGIDQSLYSRFELGKAHIYIDKFVAICDVLKASPFLLFYSAGYKGAYSEETNAQGWTQLQKEASHIHEMMKVL